MTTPDDIKRTMLLAILDEEQPHLTNIADLFPIIRNEIAASTARA